LASHLRCSTAKIARETFPRLAADDQPIVGKGLRQSIEEGSRFVALAEVDNGQKTTEAIENLSPKLTLLDLNMPILNGFEVARMARQKGLEPKSSF
jgi:two-component system, NarL family, nitrate/nitrite response regulator NarL